MYSYRYSLAKRSIYIIFSLMGFGKTLRKLH